MYLLIKTIEINFPQVVTNHWKPTASPAFSCFSQVASGEFPCIFTSKSILGK